MSNYATLKAAIQAAVYTNGTNDITGAGLQSVLLSIVDTVGSGYTFMGVATAGTSPGTPDANVFYIGAAGTYTNFGTSYTVGTGCIGVFMYNGSWTKASVDTSAGLALASIGYFECSTAAYTADKHVSSSDYSLLTGGCMHVKFANKTTVSATMSIGSEASYQLFYNGAQADTTNSWKAGETCAVYFDGTQYQAYPCTQGVFASGDRVDDVEITDEVEAGGEGLVRSMGIYRGLKELEMATFDTTSVAYYDIIQEGMRFNASGYSSASKYACCRLLVKDSYALPALTNYQYNVYKYVDDATGTAVYSSFASSSKTIDNSAGDIIVTFRRTDQDVWSSTDSDYIRSFIMTYENGDSLEARIGAVEGGLFGSNVTETVTVASGSRLTYYWDNIDPSFAYDVTVICANSEIDPVRVVAYQDSTSLGDIESAALGTTYRVQPPSTANRLYFFNGTYVSADTTVTITVAQVSVTDMIGALSDEVDELAETVNGISTVNEYCTSIDSSVLVELYIPTATAAWKLNQVSSKYDFFRLKLTDANGTAILSGEGSTTFGVEGKFSDCINTFIDPTTCEVLGYYILHYTGTDYAITSAAGYDLVIDKVTSLDYNPRIKKYLSRTENIVLIGDSMWGKGECNVLAPILRSITGKLVYNAGMGGCRMSWRTADGSNQYDALSYVSITEAIKDEDYTNVVSSAVALGASTNPYYLRAAELKAVDWTKPTTVIVDYCNNDLTGGVAIGDAWTYGASQTDFDRTTLLGAMNYGIYNLLNKYPLVRLIHTNTNWRYKTDANGDSVPPYAYTNANGVSDADYSEAIKDNCQRLGISFFDFLANGGRNEFNRSTSVGIFMDSSHFNAKGYERLADMIKAIDEGWLM